MLKYLPYLIYLVISSACSITVDSLTYSYLFVALLNFFEIYVAERLIAKIITIKTIPTAAASSISPDSCVTKYECTVKVLADERILSGIAATVPAVKNIAADSPTIRPTERIIPDNIPGIELGKITLYNVCNFVVPSANEPSRYESGTVFNASSVVRMITGNTIIVNVNEAANNRHT